jgi:hypothetical protein
MPSLDGVTFKISDGENFEDEAECARSPDVGELWQLGVCLLDLTSHCHNVTSRPT